MRHSHKALIESVLYYPIMIFTVREENIISLNIAADEF